MPVRAGGYVLGVRTSAVPFGDILREAFAEWLVPDADPPANLLVDIAPKVADGPQAFHRLHEGYRVLLRTRSGRQILDVLGRRLAGWDARARPDIIVIEGVVLLLAGLEDGQTEVAPSPEDSWPIASWTAGDERLSLAGRVTLAAPRGSTGLNTTVWDSSRLATFLEPVPTLPHDWAKHAELPHLLAGVGSLSAGTST